jgi:hypothetical protein
MLMGTFAVKRGEVTRGYRLLLTKNEYNQIKVKEMNRTCNI